MRVILRILPLVALVTTSCGDDASSGASSTDGASSSSSGGGGGGASCVGVICDGPGNVCHRGVCVADCRRADANPCEPPEVCDVSDARPGQCVAPDAPCATTSSAEACGAGKSCGPGSACDGAGRCYPRVPCVSVECDAGGCWGAGCACSRAIPCVPAPIGAPGETGTLHDPAFIDGLVDLEFDPTCTAWGVTLISGPDYLRSMTPEGLPSEIAGITNVNMGEVAVLQQQAVPQSGEAPSPLTLLGLDVSLAYISTPQGVARLDPLTLGLPMVIPSQTPTDGAGPFGLTIIDTGPAAVAYGMDRGLYVGNVDATGDYARLDLETQEQTVVTTFAARVYVSAAFDAVTMLVALEGGEVRLLRVDAAGRGASTLFVTSDQPVTGLTRDFFDGSVYVARRDGSVLVYDAAGASAPFQTTTDPSRISVAPDGFLYALEIPAPFADVVPHVTRWELPKTR